MITRGRMTTATAVKIEEMGSVKKSARWGKRDYIGGIVNRYGVFCALIQLTYSSKVGEQTHTLTFTIS